MADDLIISPVPEKLAADCALPAELPPRAATNFETEREIKWLVMALDTCADRHRAAVGWHNSMAADINRKAKKR